MAEDLSNCAGLFFADLGWYVGCPRKSVGTVFCRNFLLPSVLALYSTEFLGIPEREIRRNSLEFHDDPRISMCGIPNFRDF